MCVSMLFSKTGTIDNWISIGSHVHLGIKMVHVREWRGGLLFVLIC